MTGFSQNKVGQNDMTVTFIFVDFPDLSVATSKYGGTYRNIVRIKYYILLFFNLTTRLIIKIIYLP